MGAHPDDIEMGCGATIHKLIRNGNEVDSMIFTDCSDAVPTGWSPQTLHDEFIQAMHNLGVKNYSILNYENKHLYKSRQEICDELYKRRGYDLILVGSSYSSHQDHITVFEEARRAFRTSSIWGYHLANSDFKFYADIYYVVEKEDLIAKLNALKCYESQFALKRPYFDMSKIEQLAGANGIDVAQDLAETFEGIRLVLK